MTPVNIQKENYDSEQYHLFLLDSQLIFLSYLFLKNIAANKN